jgi:hypothetical protein
MCKTKNSTYREYSLYCNGKFEKRHLRLDSCMADLISGMNKHRKETLACCCGHGKYQKTVVYKSSMKIYELFSGIRIPRKKRFYSRDRQGIYYIPEVERDNP